MRGVSRRQEPDVDRMKAINVLGGVDRPQHFNGANMPRQGNLDGNPLHPSAPLHTLPPTPEFRRSCCNRLGSSRVIDTIAFTFLSAENSSGTAQSIDSERPCLSTAGTRKTSRP